MGGKTVLVTGGTGGIGRAAAIGLASMGARVGITGRDLRIGRADEAAVGSVAASARAARVHPARVDRRVVVAASHHKL